MAGSWSGSTESVDNTSSAAAASRIERILMLFRPHLVKAQVLMLVAFVVVLLAAVAFQ